MRLLRTHPSPLFGLSLLFVSLVLLLVLLSTQLLLIEAKTQVLPEGLAVSAAGAEMEEEYKPYAWYSKYAQYPDYCSTPEALAKRFIPPLPSSIGQSSQHDENIPFLGETRLLHVTAVIRHGARTPWSGEEACWDGYKEAPDTGSWDCALTTVMAPPDPNRVSEIENPHHTHLQEDDAFFLFEKNFDALHYFPRRVHYQPQSTTATTTSTSTSTPASSTNPQPIIQTKVLANELNGTCQKGQLLLQGYEQELFNGRLLRDTYAYYGGTDYDHDERMRLLDLNGQIPPWDASQLRLRADDDQRTLMSGQVLLRGLLDEEVLQHFQETNSYPTIDIHTADRTQDVLDANVHICPRLQEMKQEAHKSDAYQRWNSSDQMETLRWYAHDKLGKSKPTQILDCLMTTICTDKDLPAPVNDFTSDNDTNSWFVQLAQADIRDYTLVIKHANAQHAKLSMGPLWAEIMDTINPWLEPDRDDVPAPRLSVIGAHDTTIMPLLASLDPQLWNDTDWPPYASMIVLEVHELIDGRSDKSVYESDHVFRLLFNGQVLTHGIPNCPPQSSLSQVCDMKHLKAIVDPIATRNRDCEKLKDKKKKGSTSTSDSQPTLAQASILLETIEGMSVLAVLILLGLLAGGLGTYVLLTGRLPCSKGRVQDHHHGGGSMVQHATDEFEDEFEDQSHQNGRFVNG